MKQLFEIKQTINLLEMTKRINPYAKLELQSLEWAYEKIELEGLTSGEDVIRERLKTLEELQASKEIMGFATKPARAKQINALRWVIDEMEIDHFEPAY